MPSINCPKCGAKFDAEWGAPAVTCPSCRMTLTFKKSQASTSTPYNPPQTSRKPSTPVRRSRIAKLKHARTGSGIIILTVLGVLFSLFAAWMLLDVPKNNDQNKPNIEEPTSNSNTAGVFSGRNVVMTRKNWLAKLKANYEVTGSTFTERGLGGVVGYDNFIKTFGLPYHRTINDGSIYLYYRCSDGVILVIYETDGPSMWTYPDE